MEQNSAMIYRTSKPWHHRGIRTTIDDPDDRKAQDWQVVEVDSMTIYSGWSGLQ
jgi:hypothetical protein